MHKGYGNHNVASAVVALKILDELLGIERAHIVAGAVLLHHEGRLWRRVLEEQGPLAPRRISQALRRLTKVELLNEAGEAASALIEMRKILQLSEVTVSALRCLARARVFRIKYREYHEILREEAAFLSKVMPLYWLIQLVDNRAASVRESAENYWLGRLGRLMANARDAESLADAVLSEGLARVGLTLLPVV